MCLQAPPPISPEVIETTYFNSSGVELGSVSSSQHSGGGTSDYYNAQGIKVGFVSVNQGTTVASEDAWFETVQTLDGNKVLVGLAKAKAQNCLGPLIMKRAHSLMSMTFLPG